MALHARGPLGRTRLTHYCGPSYDPRHLFEAAQPGVALGLAPSDARTPRPSDLTRLPCSEAACSAALRCEFSMVRLVLSKALGDLGARGVGTEEGATQDGHPGDV